MQVLGLLKRAQGATLQDIVSATGWQPHAVRGFLSGVVSKRMKLALRWSKSNDVDSASLATERRINDLPVFHRMWFHPDANEALDCRVYARAAAGRVGLGRPTGWSAQYGQLVPAAPNFTAPHRAPDEVSMYWNAGQILSQAHNTVSGGHRIDLGELLDFRDSFLQALAGEMRTPHSERARTEPWRKRVQLCFDGID